MVFSSIPFLFFFIPIFMILYSITPFLFKNGVILIFSLLFYAWGEPIYIVLMIIETLSDYLVGRVMAKAEGKMKRRLLLLWSIIFDLGILTFFKYSGFLIGTINGMCGLTLEVPQLALPVGISFFTFQSLSYVIDLYRCEIDVEYSYLSYLTYVSMFPQLVAGPIVRFSSVQQELHNRTVTADDFYQGALRFMRGLFKKVLLANRVGAMYEQVNAVASSASVMALWLGAIGFTFQIYFDFSGYSDMAIGMGRMMGFHFDENFKHPLTSISIADFWRRWHISLSSWFKSYVYIPLGGNRGGSLVYIRNIFVVWMLTGLWHGASWNYVMWGLYFGIILVLEKRVYGKFLEKWPSFFKHFYSFILVVVSLVIFSHCEMSELALHMSGLFGLSGHAFFSSDFLWFFKDNFVVLLCCAIFCTEAYKKPLNKIKPLLSPVYLLLFIVSIACIVNDSYNPFLYFRF